MPVYTYVCPNCSRVFDVEKAMKAPHPVYCGDCGYEGPLMRWFNQPSIKYRCSGFYTTDSKLDTFDPGYDGPDEVTLMEMGENVPGRGEHLIPIRRPDAMDQQPVNDTHSNFIYCILLSLMLAYCHGFQFIITTRRRRTDL